MIQLPSVILESVLTSKKRNALPDSAFVFPKERKYPVTDEAHARSALSYVSRHGTDEEKAKVRAAVKKRFPKVEVSEERAFANALIDSIQAAMILGAPLEEAIPFVLENFNATGVSSPSTRPSRLPPRQHPATPRPQIHGNTSQERLASLQHQETNPDEVGHSRLPIGNPLQRSQGRMQPFVTPKDFQSVASPSNQQLRQNVSTYAQASRQASRGSEQEANAIGQARLNAHAAGTQIGYQRDYNPTRPRTDRAGFPIRTRVRSPWNPPSPPQSTPPASSPSIMKPGR